MRSPPIITQYEPPTGAIRLGSEQHQEPFCRQLLETHDLYEPSIVDWPKLDAETQNDRRLAPYDSRLIRRRFAPAMIRLALRFMKEKPAPQMA